MKRLTDKTIKEAEESRGQYLLLLTTYYCGACEGIRRQLEEIEKSPGIPGAEVELYSNPRTAWKYAPNR